MLMKFNKKEVFEMKDKKIRALTLEEEGKISGGVRQEEYNKDHGKIKLVNKAYGGPEPRYKRSSKKDDSNLK